MPLEDESHCQYCKKLLFGGRTDRKFCGDTCRNAFNRVRRKSEAEFDANPEVTRISSILKKNHALLLKFNPGQQNEVIADRGKLHHEGFVYIYYTAIEVLEDGKFQYHCFDQYWVDMDYGMVLLGVIDK